MVKQNINLYLASPRGFCAGVDRAVKIVEQAIKKFEQLKKEIAKVIVGQDAVIEQILISIFWFLIFEIKIINFLSQNAVRFEQLFKWKLDYLS